MDWPDSSIVGDSIQELHEAFCEILSQFTIAMNDCGITVFELKSYIAHLPVFTLPIDRPTSLLNDGSESILDFTISLSRFCDHLNPVIFENLVKLLRHRARETSVLLKKYTEILEYFEKQTKLKDFVEMEYKGPILPDYSELEIRLKDIWKEKTLADLKQLCSRINLKLWLLKRASIGSVFVVLSVPKSERDNHNDLRRKLGKEEVVIATVDGKNLYTNKEEVSPVVE